MRKRDVYSGFAERLQKACDQAGIVAGSPRARELGRRLDVTANGAAKWLAGEGMPDMAHAAALATELGCRFEWLMTGAGSEPARARRPRLSDEAFQIAAAWDKLPESSRARIRAFLAVFARPIPAGRMKPRSARPKK